MLKKSILKGQISFELLVVVAFILVIIIPALYFFYLTAGQVKNQSSQSLASSYLDALYSAALSVYYTGNGSYVVIVVNVPEGIKNISYNNTNEGAIIVMETDSKIAKKLPFNVTITETDKLIIPGLKHINVSYNQTEVIIQPLK
jgi:uncharacterized protein (UPF0333 family)